MSAMIDEMKAISHASFSNSQRAGLGRFDQFLLTMAMEIVAKAKGSPMICPKLNFPPRRLSIVL
jgi:hypothetical protein